MKITIHIEPDCDDIASHMLELAREFRKDHKKFPELSDKNRRTLEPYKFLALSTNDGKSEWEAWAYKTKGGVVVKATKTK